MYVIAGVTGHVGSVVARTLIAQGKKVKVIVRAADKGAAWSHQGAEVALGDLGNADFLAGALQGATAFFAMLPPNHTGDFYAEQRRAADGIIAAVAKARPPYVVLLSSIGADSATDNGPIKGLHYLEEGLRPTGVHVTAIRAGNFMENAANMLGAAKMGIYPSFMPADAAAPQIATRDIGKLAAEEIVKAPKTEVIDLHGPAYSARQVAEKLGKLLGKTLQVVEVPRAGWVDGMTQAGMPLAMAQIYAEMYGGFADGKLTPKGHRFVQGTTTLDEVLPTLVG